MSIANLRARLNRWAGPAMGGPLNVGFWPDKSNGVNLGLFGAQGSKDANLALLHAEGPPNSTNVAFSTARTGVDSEEPAPTHGQYSLWHRDYPLLRGGELRYVDEEPGEEPLRSVFLPFLPSNRRPATTPQLQ